MKQAYKVTTEEESEEIQRARQCHASEQACLQMNAKLTSDYHPGKK